MSWLMRGRPVRSGYVHLRVISRRCQASSVPGVTSRWAQHGRQLPGQRRQDGAVGPVRLGPGDLAAEHRDFVPENHDLRLLVRLAAAEQRQPAEDPDHDQVEQANGHKPRSCRNQLIGANSRSRDQRRVLNRYSRFGPRKWLAYALSMFTVGRRERDRRNPRIDR